jgi:hypothetical protein
MKYKDIEVTFRLDQAEKEAKALPAPDATIPAEPTPEEKSRFEQLVTSRPAPRSWN